MNAAASPARRDEIAPAILDEAIAWVVRLESGRADERTRQACAAWRAAHPAHEQAWQRLQAWGREFPAQPAVAPELALRTLEGARQNRRLDEGRRKTLKLLGVGAGSLLLARFAADSALGQRWRADYATAPGERRRVELADGSELRLNTDSAVDLAFSPTQRLIVLRHGEIFISSGQDSAAPSGRRPLRVQTAQGCFEAIGTRFFVRQENTGSRLLVGEGAVIMPAGTRSAAAIARAGEEFLIDAGGPAAVAASSFDAAAWVDGVLVARRMRLADFLAELSRYRRGWLHCDPAVADLRLSGVFQLDGDAAGEQALEAMARTLPVRIVRRSRYWLTVTRA